MHQIICNPKENEYEIDYINSCTLQEWCDNDIEELGLVKLQMKRCVVLYIDLIKRQGSMKVEVKL
jgi:hypothetical protein